MSDEMKNALADALAFIRGDIAGSSQRDGILREGDAAIEATTVKGDGLVGWQPIGAPATTHRTVEQSVVRPEVARFVILMERELRANDHKVGWKCDEPAALAERVEQEARELSRAVSDLERQIIWSAEPPYGSRGNGWSRTNPENGRREIGVGYKPLEGKDREVQLAAIGSEAADVANMAMMVADVCGQLPAPPGEATPEAADTITTLKGEIERLQSLLLDAAITLDEIADADWPSVNGDDPVLRIKRTAVRARQALSQGTDNVG